MKIISHFHGVYQNNFIVLKLVDENDRYIVEKLFRNKKYRPTLILNRKSKKKKNLTCNNSIL